MGPKYNLRTDLGVFGGSVCKDGWVHVEVRGQPKVLALRPVHLDL